MTAVRLLRTRTAPLVRAVAWLGLLALGHVGLTAAGRTLPTPPAPWQTDAFVDWAMRGDVARTSFAVLRLLGLAAVWYLAAITVLVLLAHLSGLRPLAFLAHHLALPWARRLVHHALGAGLAVTLAGGIVPLTGAGLAGAAPAPAATAVMPPGSDDVEGNTITMTAMDDSDIMVMERLPDERPTTTAATADAVPVGRSLARATASMHLLDDEAMPTWTIAPGDHLWHVAASTLESRTQRPPTESEVARYWTVLVEHNRGRLAAPGEPDLVYPGQVFELPPVPGTGR